MAHEAAINRIRKLMEHANCSGATEAETESYLAKARKMMDELGVTEDVILTASDEESKRRQDAETCDESAVHRVGSVPKAFVRCAQAVCCVTDTGVYTSTRYTKPMGREDAQEKLCEHLIFYGLKRDVAIARELYAELHASVHAMARLRCGKGAWTSSHASYAHGFTERLLVRAQLLRDESKRATAGPVGSTSIILAKDAILARKREALGLVSRKSHSRGHSISDGTAYANGQQDGNNVSLGTNQVRGRAQSQLT